MSTLTKVLIVLLTVFSIFLCGIVVTYVANADNQRERADRLQRDIQSARRSQTAATQDLEKAKEDAETMKADLDAQITDLGLQIKNLTADVDRLRRENMLKTQEAANSAKSAETASAAVAALTQESQTTKQEIKVLEAERIERRKELDETNQILMERMAIIADLQTKNRQLTEDYAQVQAELNRYLQQYGRMAARPQPVTQLPSRVGPTPLPAQPLGLNGQVTEVDMRSRLATISIGKAAGVRQDMTFHVTRGSEFVANILILEVWPDKAVGIVDRVRSNPQVGDRVTTNL